MVPIADTSIVALDLLLDRLSWPVKLVRWRAAKAIRRLIQSERTWDEVSTKLLAWLAARNLESEVVSVLSLLTIVEQSALPPLKQVTASIARPSILSDMLLEVLYGWSTGGWDLDLRSDAPDGFEPSLYYEQHKTAHVPPVLFNNLAKLEKSGRPFTKQWAFEWHMLREETQILFTDYPYYFGDALLARSEIHVQVLQRQAELYRSAYLRVLAHAVAKWDMPIRTAYGYCLDVLPAVPGLFEIEPTARPAWVGDLPRRLHDPGVDFDSVAKKFVDAGRSKSAMAVAIDAPLPRDVAEFGAVAAHAFFCSPDFEPKDDFNGLPRESLVLSPDIGLGEDINFWTLAEARIEGKAGWCAPVCTHLIPVPHGVWHDEYVGAGLSAPMAYCFERPPRLTAGPDGLALSSDGRVAATTRLWHDFWTPLAPRHGSTRIGVVASLDRKVLRDALKRLGARIGWHVRLSVQDTEHSYDGPKVDERSTFFFDPKGS